MKTKFLDLETLHLASGSHESLDEGACLMEAVSYVAGEPWSDSPKCASPVISAFMRSWNDGLSDDKRQSLKAYIPRLIGTRDSQAVENQRALIAADWLIRVHTPAWLLLAGLPTQAAALVSLPEITSFAQVPSIKGPLEAARDSAAAAWDAARAAAWAAARDAARDAARAAAGAAAGDAAWDAARAAAGDAAWDAARAAARAAAWDAARAAAWAAARDAARAAAGDAARDAARAAAGAAAGDAAWAAAGDAARAAARAAAWAAARDAARAAARDAARDAAGDAAWDALKPTVDALQATVPALIERMLAAKEDAR